VVLVALGRVDEQVERQPDGAGEGIEHEGNRTTAAIEAMVSSRHGGFGQVKTSATANPATNPSSATMRFSSMAPR
jgi:hypothetical protein